MGWLVLGLRPAGDRGVRSDSKEVWAHGTKSECPSRAPMVAEVRPKRRYARHEGAHRGRSPQGVGRRRRDRRSHRRAPRACQLPAGPRRPEVPRTLGETVPRAPLGGGERRRPRSAPGGEVGGARRVGGGRAAQALGAGAGALVRWQRPQERRGRCPRHRAWPPRATSGWRR